MELSPYVVSFTDEDKQYKRSDTDKVKWATAEVLFQANQGIDFQPELVTNTIIPTPCVNQMINTLVKRGSFIKNPAQLEVFHCYCRANSYPL
ncbi:protein of unknown function [Shewanella benthica]|uniref:Uncharacterized protein n=1 Tax=Shewanella benthica TaxID=43661 RepID=A0A330M164_9GAMM|nr:protein of unknown function [Shewanella benthica]